MQREPACIRQRRDHNRRIQCSITKAGDLAGRGGLAQFQTHVGARQAERPDRVRKSPVKCASDITEPHKTGATRCRLTRHMDRMLRLLQRHTRFAKKRASGVGKADDPVSAPLDQGHAQIILQPPDRHRQGGLRHAKPMRGAVEMPFLGNGDELLHLPQVNHPARDF